MEMANSNASHGSLLRYALSLANRTMQGDNPYRDVDWRLGTLRQALGLITMPAPGAGRGEKA